MKENSVSCKVLDRYDGEVLAHIFISRLRTRKICVSLVLNLLNKLVPYLWLNLEIRCCLK